MLYFLGSCLFFYALYPFLSRLLRELSSEEEKRMFETKAPEIKYDVFVSFRGEDIRRGFLSHLNEAFQRMKINAFMDDNMKKGEEISPSLVAAILGSSISLIIFSQNYASSRWCLEELVTILECKEKYRRSVIPVFYYVEPTHVRHQSSESYKNAFSEHESKHKTKVQPWRRALNKSANISGIHSSKFLDDAELVKEIVNIVLKMLVKRPVKSKTLVGINEKVKIIESWIKKEPRHTRLIGIWGMGGIGKTTLAEEVFRKLQSEYEGSYFLANERDQSNKHELVSLKEKMFSKLLGYDVKFDTPNLQPEDIVRRIGHKKVLVVLDDVNDPEHVEKILGTSANFGSGSSIIVTTRDRQVLRANQADEIYQLEGFNFDRALELFNLNVFNQSDHKREFDKLSKKVVDYAQGIPLVVKVLAGLLRGKSKEEWESMLDKLKKIPPTKVYEVMKLSYDDLDRKGQQNFLDLACFFLRTNLRVNVGDIKSLLKDNESDNSVDFELGRLEDKALITISENNFISIHDRLQEMAWEIVCQESIEDPGSRSRLLDADDIKEALISAKVNEAARSIRIQLETLEEQKLMLHIFAKMSKLKFLKISMTFGYHFNAPQLNLDEGLQLLATELRYLYWDCYPFKSLPQNSSLEKLVILKLKYGQMEKLWDGVKNLVNLKHVDLSCSKKLKELPDLSKAANLEVLDLSCCYMLTSAHPSIFSLPKLQKLYLCCCYSLTILASDSQLCSLSYLSLVGCQNLREFSLISENLKELSLQGTNIKALPSSIKNLTQLIHLDVRGCSNLQTIAELPLSLETLDANLCTSLKTVLLPSTVEQLKENRKQVLFYHCYNLDEHTLVAIGLNAQFNMVKYANHCLPIPNDNHVENYMDYDYNYDPYQVFYKYPGSSVPEWLDYKTRKNYIIIDLSSTPPSPLLGFIFCFVLGHSNNTFCIQRIYVDISTIGDVDDKGKKDSHIMYIKPWIWKIESDEVCVIYDQRCSDFLIGRAKNQTRFKVQVKGLGVLFQEEDERIDYVELQQPFLKEFGVSPISSTKMGDLMYQFH